MALRIGCDLDGVLADMDRALAMHAAMLFGGDQPEAGEPDAISPDSLPAVTLNLTARQQRLLWQHVRSVRDFWETLHEIESGAVARLADLAAAMRWEVIFLTKRPDTEGRTAQVQSQHWLETNGFPLPSVFVVRGSRGRIASALALDVVVDDRLENCLDVMVDSKSRAILVSRDENAQLPASARRLGIGVVRSVAECLDILSDAAAMRGERETVLTRLMRTMGF